MLETSLDLKLDNGMLEVYKAYTDDTESPQIFHLWSMITGVSAALGRRCYLPFGTAPLYPNLYTLLVGPPATRKSTAMKIIKRRLVNATRVRIAPSDTGGKRQGIIAAMAGRDELEEELADQMQAALLQTGDNLLEDIGSLKLNTRTLILEDDKHCMLVAASEFTTFAGSGNGETLTFLQEMYDGEDYPYQLKNETITLREPLLTILGCTTATQIATCLPAEAIGQGFMSRVILVYASRKRKNIAFPDELDPDLEKHIDLMLKHIESSLQGPFVFGKNTKDFLKQQYEINADITDHRFVHYIERRFTHVLKVCMSLCAMEGGMEIKEQHAIDAIKLLQFTEIQMPEALGEFGMSPLAKAKQKLMDFVTSVNEPITRAVIWSVMHRDMSMSEFPKVLADLVNAGKIDAVTTTEGEAYIGRVTDNAQIELINELAMEVEDEQDGN